MRYDILQCVGVQIEARQKKKKTKTLYIIQGQRVLSTDDIFQCICTMYIKTFTLLQNIAHDDLAIFPVKITRSFP